MCQLFSSDCVLHSPSASGKSCSLFVSRSGNGLQKDVKKKVGTQVCCLIPAVTLPELIEIVMEHSLIQPLDLFCMHPEISMGQDLKSSTVYQYCRWGQGEMLLSCYYTLCIHYQSYVHTHPVNTYISA